MPGEFIGADGGHRRPDIGAGQAEPQCAAAPHGGAGEVDAVVVHGIAALDVARTSYTSCSGMP